MRIMDKYINMHIYSIKDMHCMYMYVVKWVINEYHITSILRGLLYLIA